MQKREWKKIGSKTLLAAAGIGALAFSPAYAYEGGSSSTEPGSLIGASAGVPPPGIYMFDQVFTHQTNLAGPGTGGKTNIGFHVDDYNAGFLFVPGWTFLGATYDAVIVQAFVDVSVGNPVNSQDAGSFNTYIAPIELAWKLGDSGFHVKTALGIFVPDGTKTGLNGLGNVGNPWWTFEPELALSYLKDGWNLTAYTYLELNTANRITHYTSGDVFHADFTATKTIGKWTFGPVAYYYGQVTNDSCPVSCIATGESTLLHASSFNVWAVGGLLGYDFGPASVSVWATDEVSAKASNVAAAAATGFDPSTVPQGVTVYATVSYRLWAPEAPVQPAVFHK